jgi:hypothetical protein
MIANAKVDIRLLMKMERVVRNSIESKLCAELKNKVQYHRSKYLSSDPNPYIGSTRGISKSN